MTAPRDDIFKEGETQGFPAKNPAVKGAGMPSCPFCGADNPQDAPFCSLCLARLTTEGARPAADRPETGHREGFPSQAASSTTGYVSPGDFRAVSAEMPRRPVGKTAHPGRSTQSRHMSAGGAISLVLKHSLIVFGILVLAGFLLGFLLAGAFFSGGTSGFYVTLGLVYAVEAFLLIWGGYRISMEAMERDRGWLYGTACVAAVIFFWQPLVAFLIGLLLTERVVVPQTFNPVGILVALFLFLPLGALGGWLAEKRYLG